MFKQNLQAFSFVKIYGPEMANIAF